MIHLGFYNTSGSRTHVRFQFPTYAQSGANVAPSSAFEAVDLRIYRAADSAAFSATQRASSSGIMMTSPFDSLTGYHDVDIDLTDNADAGFYASGYLYLVTLAPDETVDSQTLTGVPLAYFEIGVAAANVTQFGGTNGTFSGGRPEVNTTHWGGTAVASANVLIDGAITAAKIASDAITDVKVAADVTIASVTGAVGSVTGAVGSVSGDVAGKVLGGGAGTITGTGVRAVDASGNAIAPASATTALQTSVDDLPTNAELSTALAGADDAVLAAVAALNNLSANQAFSAVLTTQLTESYAADGTAPTLAQAIFLIQQSLHEFAISGTTRTVKKLDGTTTAAVFTLDDDSSPTSTTRSA